MTSLLKPQPKATAAWLLTLVALAAIAGMSAIWAGAASLSGGNAGWMSLIVALDAVLLLYLAGQPGGQRRILWALAITLATVLAAAALIAAAKIGAGLGLRPAESLGRMSLNLVLLYWQANLGWIELCWVAAGCALAARVAR
ncbi:hypothetical protein [Pseudomarimonas arenosa]|uniref:Uncharacterized protein n=1 Tax=Pseudomarimonas arenosa TaxID=2774145 RepID=A0AAW3ZK13_9GAMM|nr:hypothetical protein [Pseudomarimonas arenosa]MBD8525549.1 hypothetical protein [Pseudomarimonas arenosa]